MFKWLLLFTALFPGLAVSGLNGGATISYNEDGRELTLRNGEQGYWWIYMQSSDYNYDMFSEADLGDMNNGQGIDPTGQNGFLLEYPSTWIPSPGVIATWQGFKFFSDNGAYIDGWPHIPNICKGCEFYRNVPYATNNEVLTFTSSQSNGNYSTTLRYMGAWKTNSNHLPASMPTKHIKTSTVKYYVLNGQVYFGTMATSCDITTQDLVMNFGNVPPGTTSGEKGLSISIKCNASSGASVPVRVSIQGDEYSDNKYAVKRGDIADTYLSIFCDEASGDRSYSCNKTISNSGLNTTLYGKITTKNKAGAFEEHYVVTVEID